MNYKEIFLQNIVNIPRPSHHEEGIADFLCAFAKEHGLEWKRDENNCVVIRKAATAGYENHPQVVLLNHMDMVCVSRSDKRFNATTDAITPISHNENGEEWMHADGTSLGADNGIGLSMALAVLADNSIEHPALEVLCTTNEEDGMSGAENLAADLISGRTIINLDSEAYDEITTSSAGAYITKAHLPYHRIEIPEGYVAYEVNVFGGKGGHSGVDINRGRGNAIKILSNLLLVAVRQANIKLYLVSMHGGEAAAAIPAEASAKIVIPHEDCEAFETLVKQCDEALQMQFAETDSDIEVTCDSSVWNGMVINEEGTHLLLAAINAIPVGPVQMKENADSSIGDSCSVLTSNNIGLIKQSKDAFTILIHTRSFNEEAMHDLVRNIHQIFSLTGAQVECLMDLAPWNEDCNHPLLQMTCNAFEETLGFTPRLASMHFALEAGHLIKQFPDMHMVSIGPRILEPHSVNERVSITTADNIYRVLISLLKKL